MITWNTTGLEGAVFSRQTKDSLTTTTFYVSRRCMERTSFFKLSRCWLRNFSSLVPLFLIMKTREDQLSAFTVSHVITCHGRDHLVNIQSGATQSG